MNNIFKILIPLATTNLLLSWFFLTVLQDFLHSQEAFSLLEQQQESLKKTQALASIGSSEALISLRLLKDKETYQTVPVRDLLKSQQKDWLEMEELSEEAKKSVSPSPSVSRSATRSSTATVSPSSSKANKPKSFTKTQDGAVELGSIQSDVVGWDENIAQSVFNDPSITEVFVVPHSHCDAGWLSTFEQYYVGKVRAILNSVVVALEENPSRKFTWVEIGFFERWWREISEQKKNSFRKLLANKQIDFSMGGWVSSDEASVTYMQSINQLTEGHRYINQTFGQSALPSIGWQIDPFGLSQVTTSIFSQMCFDGHVAWRISEPEMKTYLQNKTLEFIWRGSESLGPSSDLLMHLLAWGYATPKEFLFDDPGGMHGTPEQMADALAGNFQSRAQHFRSKVLMWPWGHDFHFVDAGKLFSLMDKIIRVINGNPQKYKLFVRYSTPKEYFDRLHSQTEQTFQLRQKDFYPYHAGPANYWTGYFTSRPVLKSRLRFTDHIQRSAEFMFAHLLRLRQSSETRGSPNLAESLPLVPSSDDSFWQHGFDTLVDLRRVQGIMQHHDAITGTMREHVLNDYNLMLDSILNRVSTLIQSMTAIFLTNPTGLSHDEIRGAFSRTKVIHHNSHLDFSSQELSDGKSVVAVVHLSNSLPWERDGIHQIQVRLDNFDLDFEVFGSSGENLPFQFGPFFSKNPKGKLSIQNDNRIFNLYVKTKVSALGSTTIFVHAKKRDSSHSEVKERPVLVYNLSHLLSTEMKVIKASQLPRSIEGSKIRVDFDHGKITNVFLKEEQRNISFDRSFWNYETDHSLDNHYTFTARGDPKMIDQPADQMLFAVVMGPLVQEHISCSSNLICTITRVFEDSENVELIDFVTPSTGISTVSRFRIPSISNHRKFYTDDSGLEMIERTYDASVMISANYYPMVYSSFIKDNDKPIRFSVVSAEPHGATSAAEDSILEIMIHRNSIQHHGNGERMDDRNEAHLTSWMLFSNKENARRAKNSMLLNFPVLSVGAVVTNVPDSMLHERKIGDFFTPFFSPMDQQPPVPDELFIPTFEVFDLQQRKIAVRVNHLKDRIVDHGRRLAVDLSLLFGAPTKSVEERTLSFVQPATECKRYHWHEDGETLPHGPLNGEKISLIHIADERKAGNAPLSQTKVAIDPMEIRSFLVEF